jgi:hypothetical protein
MPKGQPTDPQIKAEIMTKIRHEGLSITDASTTYGISAKSNLHMAPRRCRGWQS